MFKTLIRCAGATVCVLAAASFMTTVSVSAQTSTGTISGHVTDSATLAIPGATVTAALRQRNRLATSEPDSRCRWT
jgi:hypothetical protein